jgi:hypothetical protein
MKFALGLIIGLIVGVAVGIKIVNDAIGRIYNEQ